MEICFIHTQILVYFHMKGFALGLALKPRRKATRKSPIHFLSDWVKTKLPVRTKKHAQYCLGLEQGGTSWWSLERNCRVSKEDFSQSEKQDNSRDQNINVVRSDASACIMASSAPSGLLRFLDHAHTLHPANNLQGQNGFAREFQVFLAYDIEKASSFLSNKTYFAWIRRLFPL